MTRGTIERAFEMARSGKLRSVKDIKRKLSAEGHEAVEAHLSATGLRRQLTALLQAGATPAPDHGRPSPVDGISAGQA